MQLIDIHERNHQYQRCLNSILEIEMLKMLSYQSQFYNENIKAKTEETFLLSSTGFQIFFLPKQTISLQIF